MIFFRFDFTSLEKLRGLYFYAKAEDLLETQEALRQAPDLPITSFVTSGR